MMESRFTLEDFRSQLNQVKKMGPIGQVLQMIPGAGQMAGAAQQAVDEGQLKRIEAIIDSMTPEERRHPELIKASRRRRIATGSGTTTADVNRAPQAVRRDAEADAAARQRAAAGRGRPARDPGSASRMQRLVVALTTLLALLAGSGRGRLPDRLRRRGGSGRASGPGRHRGVRHPVSPAVGGPEDEPVRHCSAACPASADAAALDGKIHEIAGRLLSARPGSTTRRISGPGSATSLALPLEPDGTDPTRARMTAVGGGAGRRLPRRGAGAHRRPTMS